MYLMIAYDIANRKRLSRVARLMKCYGVRVQKSVFECHIQPAQLDDFIREVKTVLRMKEDRIHIYRICESCQSKFNNVEEPIYKAGEESVLII